MNQPSNAGSASTLFKIAGIAASLAFGVMVATLFALKSAPNGFAFELNVATFVSFFGFPATDFNLAAGSPPGSDVAAQAGNFSLRQHQ